MKVKALLIYLIKKLSNLTFYSRNETYQQYHVRQIVHLNWNFMEPRFLLDINVFFHWVFYVTHLKSFSLYPNFLTIAF